MSTSPKRRTVKRHSPRRSLSEQLNRTEAILRAHLQSHQYQINLLCERLDGYDRAAASDSHG